MQAATQELGIEVGDLSVKAASVTKYQGLRDFKDQLMRVNLQVVARECGRGRERAEVAISVTLRCGESVVGKKRWVSWEEEQDALEMEHVDVFWQRPRDRSR